VRRKPANSTLFVEDDGKCFVHPEREPQRYSIGARPTCCDNPATEVTLKDGEAGRKCRSCGKFTNYGVNVDDWSKVMDVTQLKGLLGEEQTADESGW
jgi:hypothetical protein